MILTGDSLVRNCATDLQHNLGGNYEVSGFAKPGAIMEEIVNTVRGDIQTLAIRDGRHAKQCQNGRVVFYTTWGVFILYRVSQEECTKLRESVPYVKIYRYNPKHLYPKLNGYGNNGHRKVWASGGSTYCKPSVTPYSSTAHARQRDIIS
jgi:hypothetical protein